MSRVRIWIGLLIAVTLLVPGAGSAAPLSPQITSIDPAEVLVGSPEATFVITGNGFRDRRLGVGRLQSRVVVDSQFVDAIVVSAQRIDAKIPAQFFEEPSELFVNVINGVGRGKQFLPLTGSNTVEVRVAEPARVPVAIGFQAEPLVDVNSCFPIEFFPLDAGDDRLSAEGMSFSISSDNIDTAAPGDGDARFWKDFCDDEIPSSNEFQFDGYSAPQLWVHVADPRTIRITARTSSPSLEGTSDPIRVAGGYIEGRVMRESDGTPVAGVDVYLAAPGGGFGTEPLPFQWRDGSRTFAACGIRTGFPFIGTIGYGGLSSEPVATTGSDGSFRTQALPTRGWALYFRPAGSSFLAAEWSGGALISEEALTVEIPDGETLAIADATLVPGGRISGRVSDAVTGESLGDVGVDVIQPLSGARIGHVHTTDDGNFVTAGVPGGSYGLLIRPYDREYLKTWYDGGDSLQDATPVDVSNGVETSGIDARIAMGAVVSGVVRGAEAGPLLGEVTLYDVDGATPRATGYTNQAGVFRTSPGVPAGTYRLRVRTLDATYPSGWWNGATSFASSTTITLADSEEHTMDLAMPAGGIFTGRMVSSAGPLPAPVSPGYVEVYEADSGSLVGRGCTDGTGHYSTNGLAKGRYKLRFIPRLNDLAPQWYPDSAAFAEAEPLSIDYGQVRIADAAVQRGATLAGTISDADGRPSPHVRVVPVRDNPDPLDFFSIDDGNYTDQDGRYVLRGLAPGSYALVTGGGYIPNSPTTWYPGSASRSTAGRVTVDGAEQKTALDFSVGRASFIRGHVAGLTSTYGFVEFLDPNDGTGLGYAYTDRQGDFTSDALHAGSYVVRFSAWNRSPVFHGGTFSRDGAAVVTLAGGETVSSLDGVLSPGHRITGIATAAHSGSFPEGISARVFDRATGDLVAYGVTLEGGRFTTGMVGPGTYTIFYVAGDGVFVPQWFSGKHAFASSDTITVIDADVSGVNAVLELSS